MEITRRSVLSEALRHKRMMMNKYSRDGRGLRAREGYGTEFTRYSEECRILRELMQALEYEPVKAAIAEFLERDEAEEPELRGWQMEVLQGGKQTGLFEDGYQTKNDVDHPERRDVSGRKDPVQR